MLGQYLDLRYREERPTLEQYLEMVQLKTGVLLGTACEVGALVAGEWEKRNPSRQFGEALGVGFSASRRLSWRVGKPADDQKDRKGGFLFW